MEILTWILVGGLLGWASYAYLRFNEARGALVSAVIGAVGALIGGKAIAPMLIAAGPPSDFSAAVLFIAAAAAVACLVLGNLVYRRWGF
jgi:uncharacterized membrane protein YeaQ/YmgE (transglycosylase-associated protein family)